MKIHRNITDWRWYHNSEMVHLFIHLLLMANYSDKEWENITIKRGQLVTSRQSLSKETGLSEKMVRTLLKKLVQTGEIEMYSTNKHTLITVTKYDDYQGFAKTEGQQRANKGPTKGQQRASKGPAKGQQRATIEEYKEEEKKEEENDDDEKKRKQESSICPELPPIINSSSQEGKELIDFEEFERYFNDRVQNTRIPKIRSLNSSSSRKSKLCELAEKFGADALREVVEKTVNSEFLRGEIGQWRADFDWIFRLENFNKIYEGKYDNFNYKTENHGVRFFNKYSENNAETIRAGLEIIAEMERKERTNSHEIYR